MHVHIISPDGEAKFWLEPGIKLEKYVGFKKKDLARIERTIEEHRNEFIEAWNEHFS